MRSVVRGKLVGLRGVNALRNESVRWAVPLMRCAVRQCAARCLARRGIDWQVSPSASRLKSSGRPLRIRRANSSDVKGRLGSSCAGYRIRGLKNQSTRLASPPMSNPSRQQQTFHCPYCSSRSDGIARGGSKPASKISTWEALGDQQGSFSRQSRGSARTRHSPGGRSERRWQQRSRQDIPSPHRS